MTEYINKAELIEPLGKWLNEPNKDNDAKDVVSHMIGIVRCMPTIEIVRCKDCKHTDKYGYCNIIRANPPLLFYCRSGERKEKIK